jgi:AraC family transcriptional regulator
MGEFDLSKLTITNDVGLVLAHSPASKSCLPITVKPIPAEAEVANHGHGAQRILVAHRARGRRWYQMGGKTRQMLTTRSMVEIYEDGLTFDHCRWEGEAGHAIAIEFSEADLQAITHGEVNVLKFQTQHEVFDVQVSSIALNLADEALNGSPNGQLYTQGLCLSLIGIMANRFNSTAGKGPACVTPGHFGPRQKKQLLALVQENLGADLSLARMAEEVGLSTYHFARVFKSTFGDTPHRYVQERRVEAAAESLRNDQRASIAEIAQAHGFASQAHMTSLVRQRFGITPRSLRLV